MGSEWRCLPENGLLPVISLKKIFVELFRWQSGKEFMENMKITFILQK